MLFRLLFGGERVSSYTVFESPAPPVDRLDRAEALVFVKDGFSLQAMLFAPFWLLAKRAWLALAAYAACAIALAVAANLLAIDSAYLVPVAIALHLIVGFEAGTIERLSMEHKGWSRLGELVGTSVQDCERRFLDLWLPMQPGLRTATPATRDAERAPPMPAATTAERPASLMGRLLGRKG